MRRREGWLPLVGRVAEVLRDIDPAGEVAEASEKNGMMRICVRSAATQAQLLELYRWAAGESLCICEICGEDGSLRCWGLHLQVRCDRCDRCDDELIHG